MEFIIIKPYNNHLKMEKKNDVGINTVNPQKPLEQGRTVCYTGLDRHGIDIQKARHA